MTLITDCSRAVDQRNPPLRREYKVESIRNFASPMLCCLIIKVNELAIRSTKTTRCQSFATVTTPYDISPDWLSFHNTVTRHPSSSFYYAPFVTFVTSRTVAPWTRSPISAERISSQLYSVVFCWPARASCTVFTLTEKSLG